MRLFCQRGNALRHAFSAVVAVLLVATAVFAPDTSAAAAFAQPTGDAIIDAIETDGQAMASAMFAFEPGGSLDAARLLFIDQLPQSVAVVSALTTVPSVTLHISSLEDLAAVRSNPHLASLVLPPAEASFSAATPPVIGEPVGADQFHALGIEGVGQTIAVLDTGIDSSHPDLAPAVVYEHCFMILNPQTCPDGSQAQAGPGAASDSSGHGTAVAGILVSAGGITDRGIAPAATVEVYKVGNTTGTVRLGDVLVALDYIASSRPNVDVITVSLGSVQKFTGFCQRSLWPAFFDVIAALKTRGILVVAPAGNDFLATQAALPACFEQVLGVTSTTFGTVLLPNANTSSAIDLAAPGLNIATTAPGASSAVVTGTSFSVPIVAGCIAILKAEGAPTVTIEPRLESGGLTSQRGALSIPWINCSPRCQGSATTINVMLGQTPTSGDDVILGSPGDDVIDAGDGDDVVCALDGNDIIIGGNGDDRLWGGPNADTVDGGAGNDIIHGEHGWDRLGGSTGNDIITGGFGNDWIWGGGGNDIVNAGRDNDWVWAGGGDDIVDGGYGDDNLLGLGGSDELFGFVGADAIDGGSGNDRLSGQGGADEISGGLGFDQIWGGPGDDTLRGGAGPDWIWGSWGQDVLEGNDGDDHLFGDGNNDRLVAGSGSDALDGGFGQDTCVAGSADTILRCIVSFAS